MTAPTLVQYGVGSGTGTSLSASWPAPTTAGNDLLAIITNNNGRTPTAPAGWVWLFNHGTSDVQDGASTWAVYGIDRSGSRSGSESWTWNLSGNNVILLVELANADVLAATVAKLDVSTTSGSAVNLGPVQIGQDGIYFGVARGNNASDVTSSGFTGSPWTNLVDVGGAQIVYRAGVAPNTDQSLRIGTLSGTAYRAGLVAIPARVAYLRDDYDRADQTGPGTTADGDTYTDLSTGGVIGIVGGRLQGTSSAGAAVVAAYRLNHNLPSADMSVRCQGRGSTASASGAGPAARVTDAASFTGYVLISLQTGTWELRRYDAGVKTLLASGTLGDGTFNVSARLRLDAVGSTLTCYANGQPLAGGNYTDPSPLTGTKAGVWVLSNNGGNRAWADNLRAYNLAAAGHTQNIARVTAAATARALTRRKTRNANRVTATSSPRALSRAKTAHAGRATATSTTRALGRAKTAHLARATGTGLARVLQAARSTTIGRVTSSSTARPLGRAKTARPNRATGSGHAQALGTNRTATIARVIAHGTAAALDRAKATSIGRAAAAGLARALATVRGPSAVVPPVFGDARAYSTGQAETYDLGQAATVTSPEAATVTSPQEATTT